MLDISKLKSIVEKCTGNTDLYLVDIKVTPDNVAEILIDSDSSVSIDDCISLSRAVNEEFDRDEEDFELTVASAGVGQPLKVFRQYRKLTGKPVEVVLKNGLKIVAQLRDATEDTITLAYEEKIAVEGKKRKQTIETVKQYPLTEVKSTKEFLDFK